MTTPEIFLKKLLAFFIGLDFYFNLAFSYRNLSWDIWRFLS